MTIRIVQTCNKCGKERELFTNRRIDQSVESAAENGGWRKLGDKHICEACIRSYLETANA